MSTVKKWGVDVFIWENEEGHTSVDARLVAEDRAISVVGHGSARRNPNDRDIPEIGDEMAVGRALADLGRNLSTAAEENLAATAQIPSAAS
jgi:Rv2632c-like